MNIQELQTVVYSGLNLKIIIINNNGYHSIRQTQRNLFSGREFVGIDRVSGVSFPDLSKLAPAYGLPYFRVTSQSDMDSSVRQFLSTVGPALMEVIVDENQGFEPKLSSKVMPDGSIVSPPQDDMYPFLPRQEYEGIKKAALEI
jgi:acetolactate synthase-1/2/3 large subunit